MFWAFFDEHYHASLKPLEWYLNEYLQNINSLHQRFSCEPSEAAALRHFAKKSALKFAINRLGPRKRQQKIAYELLASGKLWLEADVFDRFDKLRFSDNFERFYYYFLAKNPQLPTSEQIAQFAAWPFELAAREFAQTALNISARSIWKKSFEVDLFAPNLIGEVKYKSTAMRTSELNLLEHKSKLLGQKRPVFLLFSKSGFSARLLERAHKSCGQIICAQINDYERLR